MVYSSSVEKFLFIMLGTDEEVGRSREKFRFLTLSPHVKVKIAILMKKCHGVDMSLKMGDLKNDKSLAKGCFNSFYQKIKATFDNFKTD